MSRSTRDLWARFKIVLAVVSIATWFGCIEFKAVEGRLQVLLFIAKFLPGTNLNSYSSKSMKIIVLYCFEAVNEHVLSL